jgi:hypothetical protein
MITKEENDSANLQTILDNVRAIAHNHKLKYRLEFLYENDNGARIRLASVKPENEPNYHRTLVAGRGFTEDMQEILEEEILVELLKDHNQWTARYNQTIIPTKSKVDEHATRPAIEEIKQALKSIN